MLGTRLISGIILLIITIGIVMFGDNLLFAAVVLISFIGLFELYRAIHLEKSSLSLIGYGWTAVYFILVYLQKEEFFMLFSVGFLLTLLFFYVIKYPNYVIEQLSMVYFSVFYVAVLLSYIYIVRQLESGQYLVWLIFIGAWGSDTCAYAVGKLIGKHKLPSKLSPNKSIEGCMGGIVGAALIGVIYGTVFKEQLTLVTHPQTALAIIGAASSVLSQIGDLTASAIKRNHDIKDYGTLIPGHGGILDRFDSILFTAPIVYFLTLIF